MIYLLNQATLKAGYYIGEILLNHLMFVDDMTFVCFVQVYVGCKVY